MRKKLLSIAASILFAGGVTVSPAVAADSVTDYPVQSTTMQNNITEVPDDNAIPEQLGEIKAALEARGVSGSEYVDQGRLYTSYELPDENGLRATS